MVSVNIGELKNRFSAYLQRVRAGEEIVILNRNPPVAKLVPLSYTDASVEELDRVASGELRLPNDVLDETAFGRIGAKNPVTRSLAVQAVGAISTDRDERDGSFLER